MSARDSSQGSHEIDDEVFKHVIFDLNSIKYVINHDMPNFECLNPLIYFSTAHTIDSFFTSAFLKMRIEVMKTNDVSYVSLEKKWDNK